MIELFNPSNENYNKNGDVILQPIECKIRPEINGTWELSLFHPIDEEDRWKSIVEGAVLRVPSHNGSQRFRIVRTEKRDGGIDATARPAFLDATGDCFIIDQRPTNATGQEALNAILRSNPKYTGRSNIAARNTAYYLMQNALEAIASDEENSFLNRWGGEIEYNNNEIIVNDRLGSDKGFEIIYGKNVKVDGLRETIDMDGVITRIVPRAFNGRMLPGATPWVDSPLIGAYPTIRTQVVDYPDIRLADDLTGGEAEAGVTVCQTLAELQTKLREAANKTFTDGADKPAVSIDCDIVILKNTEEYKDLKNLEEVSLGDTVHCYHSRLGITSEARVISLTWDAITESVEEVTIGKPEPSFIQRVALSVNATEKALTKGGTVKAGSINGIIDGANARVKAQASGTQAQKEKVVFFEDLDPASSSFGAMAMGTTGFMISDTRNAEGTDWEWSTFGTGAGFSADLIVAGTLQAINILGSAITGGTITGTEITGATIKAGGAGNAGVIEVYNASGTKIGYWDNTGLHVSQGEITGSLIKTGGSGNAGQFESYYDNDFLAVRLQGGRYHVYSPNESGVLGGYITGYGSGATAGLRVNGKNGGGVRIGVENQEYFRVDDNDKSVRLLGPSATAGQNVAFVTGQNRQLALYAPAGIYINPANDLRIHNGSAYVKGYTGTKNGVQFVNGIAVG